MISMLLAEFIYAVPFLYSCMLANALLLIIIIIFLNQPSLLLYSFFKKELHDCASSLRPDAKTATPL